MAVVRHVPRSRDEELLAWLARRSGGESAHAIAKRVGKNSGVIVQATNAVRAADQKESEEDVTGGYWR